LPERFLGGCSFGGHGKAVNVGFLDTLPYFYELEFNLIH